jgi:uncharacterized phage protein gp47/JayE
LLLGLFNKYNQVKDFEDNKYIYTSEGIWLDRFLSNYNFIRKQPSKAVTDWLTSDSTPLTFVAIGALTVEDTLGNAFINTTSGNVDGTGALTLQMESVITGAIQNITAGSLTEIVTPISGINTGANSSDATGGQDQETDTAFRSRFLAGRAGKGYWNIDGIYRALLSLDGVSSVVVEENDQNIVVNGLPPHSIHCIVDGGIDAEIAQTIFEKTDTAIERFGSTMVTIQDLQGEDRDIYFDRPTTINIELQYTVIGTVDTSALEIALAEYINNAGIGSTISSWKASNYIEKQINISGIQSLTIEIRIEGNLIWLSLITLASLQKPNAVIL